MFCVPQRFDVITNYYVAVALCITGSVVVSMSACRAAGRGSIPGPGALLGVKIWLSTLEKSRRSLLSGVYARGSKISHQSALEMCTLSWTPHSSLEKDNSLNHACVSPKMGCLEFM